jgi:DUF1680 family protein
MPDSPRKPGGSGYFAKEQKPHSRRDLSYWQEDVPITDHDRIKGHAVRAACLICGSS